MRVLGQKTVPGMNGIHIADFSRADDAIDLEVALGTRGGPDTDGLVGQLHMEGVHIRLGINGQGLDPELFAGTNDAQCNLAAIGNENFIKHQRRPQTARLVELRNDTRGSGAVIPAGLLEKGDPIQLLLAQAEQHLAKLHWLAVLRHNLRNNTTAFRLDLVHHFHRLNDAHDRVLGDFLPDGDVGRRVGRRG